jgi:hypothetical protein
MARLPIHPYPPMRLAGFLSEAHTSGETVSVRHPLGACWCFSQCGRALCSSERTRLQDLERAQQLTRAVHAAPNAPLSADELCDPAGCRRISQARGMVHITGVCTRAEMGAPAGVAEGVRWLRSPPHTRASPVTGRTEPDRSRNRSWDRRPVSEARGEPVPSETEYRTRQPLRVCSNVSLYILL